MLELMTAEKFYSIIGVFAFLLLCNIKGQKKGFFCFIWVVLQTILQSITGAIYQGMFVVTIFTCLYALFLIGGFKLFAVALAAMVLIRIWTIAIGPIRKAK